MNRRVAITAVGVVSALGDTPAAFHDGLCEGRVCVREVDTFRVDGLGSFRAGELVGFDPARYLDGNLRPLDRTAHLAAAAAQLALDAAGLTRERRAGQEIGLVLGTMFGSVRTIAEFDRRLLEAGPMFVKPFDFANSVINAAAGQTAIWHGLVGINSTVAGGTTAGLQAVHQAADLIRTGRARVLLAGGAEELSFESLYGFARAGLTCPEPGRLEPAVPVPLDRGRNGFALGEGAALFLLEDLADARARGAEILAEIAGYACAFDPRRGRDDASAVAALERAVRQALDASGEGAAAIDAVSLSANGSVRGDRLEALGLAAALGERVAELPVTAVKAALGETLGAAGAFQLLALVGALERGVVPGIAGLGERDPELPLAAARAEPRPLAEHGGPRRGLVSALGLDGNACALVVAR